MRGIYVSPTFGIIGAVIGAIIVLVPVDFVWPSYGGFEELKFVLLIPTRWAVALGICGAVVGDVLDALAGRSIVEAAYSLFERVTSQLPWWW